MGLLSSLRMGGSSIRSIFTFVIVVVVTAFLWATFGTTTSTHAADATWSGSALNYDNRQYQEIGKAQANESHGLPVDAVYFLTVEEIPNQSTTSRTALDYKAHVIYFAPGADPPSQTTATYVTYDYDLRTKVFSQPANSQTITVVQASSGDLSSTCVVEGVGWIVCSVSYFLAEGMDLVFEILTGFMVVQPIQTNDTHGGLYVAWNIMRNIANVAFIIVFLIIIYSQLTSVGLTNYGLKKLLPRLIVAAILVNMSYIICAIAVDISNILGYSLQDIFIQIRNSIFQINDNTWSGSMTSWRSLTGFILSGGTAALAGGIGIATAIASTGGTVAGAIFLVLPALVGLLLAVLTVLLILAARQAIIIIFIIIAPLAFVAYLLPNTEKWFNKWREVFMTMLIFFPAFSVVFGGSQLAGAVIIQNASSINTVILGMIVQVAPLIITPLLLKFSGNLLGKIAGIINNPNKGLLDRTRKWSDTNREYHRQRGISGTQRRLIKTGSRWYNRSMVDSEGELGKSNFLRRSARRIDMNRRRLEDRTKNAGGRADNYYHDSADYGRLHTEAHKITVRKDDIENRHALHIQQETNQIGSDMYKQNVRLEGVKYKLEKEKMTTTARTNQYKSGTVSNVPADLQSVADDMARTTLQHAAQTRRAASAQYIQQKYVAEKFSDGSAEAQALLQTAGGNDYENGVQRALADALTTLEKASDTNVQNVKTIIKHKNPDDTELLQLAMGIPAKGIDPSMDVQAAANEMIFSSGNGTAIIKAYEELDFSFPGMAPDDAESMRVAIADTLEANKTIPTWLTYALTGKMRQGKNASNNPFTSPYKQSGIDAIFMDALNKGAVDAGSFVDMFNDYIKGIDGALSRNRSSLTPDGEKKLREALTLAFDRNGLIYHKLGGKRDALSKIAIQMGIPHII